MRLQEVKQQQKKNKTKKHFLTILDLPRTVYQEYQLNKYHRKMNSRAGISTKQEGKMVIRISEVSEPPFKALPSGLPVGTLHLSPHARVNKRAQRLQRDAHLHLQAPTLTRSWRSQHAPQCQGEQSQGSLSLKVTCPSCHGPSWRAACHCPRKMRSWRLWPLQC